ncbi:MAG: F0F1 ATP synthase subunit B [Bacteroidaceae bacterium]|nr:F0F1 ATP synthase subunit B [Bacteroidaceae bacterium]
MFLLTPDSGLIFWMLIAFGVVFFVLAKYGWPVITKMIDSRKQYIDESLENARKANERLAQLQEETAQMLKQAQEQQSKILAEAVEMRNQIVEKAKTEATNEGQKLLQEAKQQIAQEKESAIRDIRREVGVLSVEIAEKVLRQNLQNDDDQMAMIDRMLDEIMADKNI